MNTETLKDEERTRCEIWSRCMGYHRPVSAYNIGKQQEYRDRTPFREPALAEDFRDSWPKSQPPGIDFKFKFTRA